MGNVQRVRQGRLDALGRRHDRFRRRRKAFGWGAHSACASGSRFGSGARGFPVSAKGIATETGRAAPKAGRGYTVQRAHRTLQWYM